MAHGLSCSAVCGIFPDQGSNPDSNPLCHQGRPRPYFHIRSHSQVQGLGLECISLGGRNSTQQYGFFRLRVTSLIWEESGSFQPARQCSAVTAAACSLVGWGLQGIVFHCLLQPGSGLYRGLLSKELLKTEQTGQCSVEVPGNFLQTAQGTSSKSGPR